MMNESQKRYIKNCKNKMEIILESNQYNPEQQYIGFFQICEYLLLLNLEEKPNITGPIIKLLDRNEEIIKEIEDKYKKLNLIMETTDEIKTLKKEMEELSEERYDNIKNFFKNFKKIIQ